MPVYPHLDLDYRALQMGPRIREQRKTREWTLRTLASKLSVSVGTLSAIENQRVALDVDLLLAISRVMSIPLEKLLPSSTTRHYHIARRSNIDGQPALPIRLVNPNSKRIIAYHNRMWPRAEPFVGKYIEPFDLEILPVADDDLRFISHNHEEFLFVLSGRVECLIKTPDGLTQEKLGPGDCTYFWSYLPHCIRSRDKTPARSIHAVCSHHEPVDWETSNGMSGPVMYLTDSTRRSFVPNIAAKIISLRQARGMSATEFARHVAISVQRLTRIERGETPISLELLLNICRTCRKPIEYFLASTRVERPFSSVLRGKQIQRLRSRSADTAMRHRCLAAAIVKPLAEGFAKRQMHPSLVSLDAVREKSAKLHRHSGQEFVYVLNGTVKLLTRHDGQQVTEMLFPGDSCLIESSVPHRLIEAHVNPYERRARLIVVRRSHADADGES